MNSLINSLSLLATNKYSKIFILLLFIILPIIGFVAGIKYQKNLYFQQSQQSINQRFPTVKTTPTLVITPTEQVSLPPVNIRNAISSVLPDKAFLRDYESLANTNKDSYLVIYIEKGYESSPWDFYSCPGAVLGEAIKGNYHLALFQEGNIVSDIKIPDPPYNYGPEFGSLLELSYRNIKANLYKTEEYQEGEKDDLETVKLLDLKDYTGDGKAYEILLTTTAGGCGFYDSLVAGYDPDVNQVILYSDWIGRFNPDEKGNYYYLFECGDHGNMTRVERRYKFNSQLKKFEKVWEKTTPCQP